MNHADGVIIGTYGAEYRGIVQYYLLASDVWRLRRLRWIAEVSMLKTLAAKHRSSVTKMARKYKATIDTPHGPRTCFQVSVERNGRKPLVARFGGIPLKRQWKAILTDRLPDRVAVGKQLITRLQTRRCELCERTSEVRVHHVRTLADLDKLGPPQPGWAALMAKRRRKTLVVCPPCHDTIHTGSSTAAPTH
jgi:Type II intron maturase